MSIQLQERTFTFMLTPSSLYAMQADHDMVLACAQLSVHIDADINSISPSGYPIYDDALTKQPPSNYHKQIGGDVNC